MTIFILGGFLALVLLAIVAWDQREHRRSQERLADLVEHLEREQR